MHVITGGALRGYWERPGRGGAEQLLRAWYSEACRAAWREPADIKARYGGASFLGPATVAFSLGGASIRLVAEVNYGVGVVLVRFVGSAEEFASAWGRAVA